MTGLPFLSFVEYLFVPPHHRLSPSERLLHDSNTLLLSCSKRPHRLPSQINLGMMLSLRHGGVLLCATVLVAAACLGKFVVFWGVSLHGKVVFGGAKS